MSGAAGERMPFAFGVNGFTAMPWTFEQDVERYAELGVDVIEVCEAKLHGRRFAEQLALLADRGLAGGAVQPLVRAFFSSQMQPEPRGLDARAARLQQSIERIAPFVPGAAFVVNTGAPETGDVAGAVETTTGRLRDLAGLAPDRGVRIALEPLNATDMSLETTIWTVGQAVNIFDVVDRPNVGLCLDL